LKNAAPKADVTDVTKAAPAAGSPSPRAPGPRPEPAERAEKKGFLDKMKEKVGLGATDDEDELPVDDMDAAPPEDFPAPPAGAGEVTLDLDRIVRPGAVVSGNVTFSDGVSGKWALDQMGRLMLEMPQKGYQPSPADVQSFQRQLQAALQRHGF
jgi:hypothetical protein